MSTFPSILLLFCLALFTDTAFAKIYQCSNASGQKEFTDKPCNGIAESVPAPPPPRPIVQLVPIDQPESKKSEPVAVKQNSYAASMTLDMRTMLRLRYFAELNKVLAEYQQQAEKNIANEKTLFTAYAAFDTQDREIERLLNEWIKARPNDYQPYVARAYYYYGGGWVARGGRWSNETSRSNFESMGRYFNLALADIEQAIMLNKRCMVPYYLKIGIYSTLGVPKKSLVNDALSLFSDNEYIARSVLDTALSINPASYYVRAHYLSYIDPRWGGSYEMMQEFVNESMQQSSRNSELKKLQGFIASNKAHMAMLQKNYGAADQYYAQALAYGDNERIWYFRGNNSYYQKDYRKAMEYYNKAIELYPEDGDYFYQRAKTFRQLHNYPGAMEDIKHALLFKPDDSDYVSYREALMDNYMEYGKNVSQLTHPAQATGLDKAISKDSKANYALAQTAFQDKDIKGALRYVRKAIEQEPEYFDAYKLHDNILMVSMQWDSIITYWNRYIELVPDNPHGYLERGGAYYHKGDINAAIRDAKAAADLGSAEGRKYYQYLQQSREQQH